ncbi:MAG: hypothetical protein MZV64_41725 [Ignavibacteriales bacterium]|nr:hypothetical protein [Ignavibacteriales bacterium]
MIGDEGSGYSIGRKALNAVSKASDGRGEETLISELLDAKMNHSTYKTSSTKFTTKSLMLRQLQKL